MHLLHVFILDNDAYTMECEDIDAVMEKRMRESGYELVEKSRTELGNNASATRGPGQTSNPPNHRAVDTLPTHFILTHELTFKNNQISGIMSGEWRNSKRNQVYPQVNLCHEIQKSPVISGCPGIRLKHGKFPIGRWDIFEDVEMRRKADDSLFTAVHVEGVVFDDTMRGSVGLDIINERGMCGLSLGVNADARGFTRIGSHTIPHSEEIEEISITECRANKVMYEVECMKKHPVGVLDDFITEQWNLVSNLRALQNPAESCPEAWIDAEPVN